jgi:hypothetical protein
VPFTSEVIVADVVATVAAVDQVIPPSLDCSTVYPVSVVPPESVGADHAKPTCVDDGVTVSDRGAEAFAPGWNVDAVAMAEPIPAALTADTRNEYEVPFVRPVTVAVSAVVRSDSVHAPPLDCSTTYDVITEPPLLDGATHVNVTAWSPGVAVSDVGADGVVAGVASTDSVAAPIPAAVTAETRN